MLGDNIKTLRKQKGISQEELATRIHVVRQTVSKWEKNLSVPDAAMLQKIAEELDASVNELLGAEIRLEEDRNEIAEQLVRINEQLAVKNRRTYTAIKTIAIVVAVLVLFRIGLLIAGISLYSSSNKKEYAVTISMDVENPVYTEDDVNDAVDVVVRHFNKNFKGCDLKEINYDEAYSSECSEDWVKQYDAEEAVVLTSSFTTDSKGGDGSFSPNETYDNWQWILTRSGSGKWTLHTWGY
ncbi:helix-turn-helix domain-containing protein [Anaerobium acetethylicum]|uniref:Transcriptional regulator, contains XRE-family HTH domain n=1 Tax=Anaerobium acetethylicum TaxID=1619234 RepID=A0A1D3TUK4_9FIRM|nr:helix-turn-helix transcriptional regulator [Anaerobium acetethylicum]SCP97732.1 Transcriptional regulator, contains XRE-family HTH domain [Anaerobium acetethylicum]